MRKLTYLAVMGIAALILTGCQAGPSKEDNPTADMPVPKVEKNPNGGPEKGGGQQAPGIKAD
ncbi:MAG: hypothetical protein JSS66_04360 [Armatimonadetes bacterium]|nr:hypothetical protein [Armatimonadota bacterium]